MSRTPAPSECPKCRAPSPCTDWNEIDIGVGVQIFDEEYTCPTHGPFGFTREGEPVFRDDEPPSNPLR
jgi:hypothetical protein